MQGLLYIKSYHGMGFANCSTPLFHLLPAGQAATLSLHSSKSAALEVCRYKFDRSSAVKKWWDDLEAAVNFTQNFPVAGFDQSLGLNLMRYWKAVWTPSKEEANVLEAHYSAVDGLLSHLDFEQIALELGTSELNIRRYFLSKSGVYASFSFVLISDLHMTSAPVQGFTQVQN
jgi:hypothetical protein